MGVAASFLPSTLPRPFPAPQRPPGACLIRSRPDLTRGPGPGGKSSLPSLSWSRSGSQETPSPWVIYRGCPGAVSCLFLLPSSPMDCWALAAHPCPTAWLYPWLGQGGTGRVLPTLWGDRGIFSTVAPKQAFVLPVTLALTPEGLQPMPMTPPITWPEMRDPK